MGKNLFSKVWDLHRVRDLPSGDTQLFVGLQLLHEVTSPQAFEELRERNIKVKYPERACAVIDHVVPTNKWVRPLADPLAEEMFAAIEKNTKINGIRFLAPGSGQQGVVHVVFPELGLIQPGMTVACGDSHTSTHGGMGALAFGIGTSQVRDILASQCIAVRKPKVRRILLTGKRDEWVTAKDVIIHVIRKLGVKGGVGFAYEFAGPVIDGMTIEERLTVCNMGIEGGARFTYVNPDEKTFEYIKGRPHAPCEKGFDKAVEFWKSIASDPDAPFDDEVEISIDNLEPQVTWGINPSQAIGISENIPEPEQFSGSEREQVKEALSHMKITPGKSLVGTKVNVVFVGSCTNGRLSDLRLAAEVARFGKVAEGVQALIVPGSEQVAVQAEKEGLDKIFKEAGFEWRQAGCSMCLAMNPDRLEAGQLCVSTSNRNFKGRQGHPGGRTVLASPATAAACALAGEVIDVRNIVKGDK